MRDQTVRSAIVGTTRKASFAFFTQAHSDRVASSRRWPDSGPTPTCLQVWPRSSGDRDGLAPGVIPKSWLEKRVIGDARVSGFFANIGAAKSLAHLRGLVAARLVHYGISDLDAAAIRLTAPRTFTQELSRFVYECTTGVGAREFAGIQYLSRLGDDIVKVGNLRASAERRGEHRVPFLISDRG